MTVIKMKKVNRHRRRVRTPEKTCPKLKAACHHAQMITKTITKLILKTGTTYLNALFRLSKKFYTKTRKLIYRLKAFFLKYTTKKRTVDWGKNNTLMLCKTRKTCLNHKQDHLRKAKLPKA